MQNTAWKRYYKSFDQLKQIFLIGYQFTQLWNHIHTISISKCKKCKFSVRFLNICIQSYERFFIFFLQILNEVGWDFSKRSTMDLYSIYVLMFLKDNFYNLREFLKFNDRLAFDSFLLPQFLSLNEQKRLWTNWPEFLKRK